MTSEPAVRPGGTLGILGGGQLGRMMALAALQLGLKVHVYCPDADAPAFDAAALRTVAPYDDAEALVRFAGACDVVTYEFENVPAFTAQTVAARSVLRPGPRALQVTQDRFEEKSFLAALGIPTAPFRKVDDLVDLEAALLDLGRPAVLKTRRLGYDGKGQRILREGDDPARALEALGHAPCILEGFVPFEREVSVVAARGLDGEVRAYDLCANLHRDHILAETRVPAGVAPEIEAEAVAVAGEIAAALDYVGVLAVEMFLGAEGAAEGAKRRIVVNEVAPRVHNSGHWTVEGAETSQFAQAVRAVCGWPLGSTRRRGEVIMENIIGADADRWEEVLREDGAQLHLYGKAEARAGRKMGHVTRVRTGGG